ncbi:zinc finger protein Dzip1-like isoform X2 [Gouania willdenowi]|uniref:zinc finger protein Dzip1-like isoform X2 n=1 Tax=Gouania willdenowi TaxID=441366 RepID=UPI0010566C52|nr:zinc finger protein Dzip1-like isoform X2 [Gouania willdenowi]
MLLFLEGVHGDTRRSPAPAPAMTPFKFHMRRESVDWRRIIAVDVDLVVSQVDVEMLQEHISMVTFCSLEGECCVRCRNPIDPSLVKLLRLAQLSLEWLLYSQEVLTYNLVAVEERLTAADRELGQLKKQEEHDIALKPITNNTSLVNSLKTENISLKSENICLKSENISLKSELNRLKEQINEQRQTIEAKTFLEMKQQSQKDLLRATRVSDKAMAQLDRKLDDTKNSLLREMESIYNQNLHALDKVSQNQLVRQEILVNPVDSQQQRDIYKEIQSQTIQMLEQQKKKHSQKWKSRLQGVKAHHKSETDRLMDELSKMQMYQSENHKMSRILRKKKLIIQAQREQIKSIYLNPPIKEEEEQKEEAAEEEEVPVIKSSPAPEPQQKRVSTMRPVSVPILDPIQELSEDSSTISEKSPAKTIPKPELRKEVALTLVRLVESQRTETSGSLTEKKPLLSFIEESDPEMEEVEKQGKVKKKNKLVRKMKILGQKISQSCRRVLSVFRCRKRSTVEESESSSESKESSTEMSSSQVTSDVETDGTMNASLTSLNDVSET